MLPEWEDESEGKTPGLLYTGVLFGSGMLGLPPAAILKVRRVSVLRVHFSKLQPGWVAPSGDVFCPMQQHRGPWWGILRW